MHLIYLSLIVFYPLLVKKLVCVCVYRYLQIFVKTRRDLKNNIFIFATSNINLAFCNQMV